MTDKLFKFERMKNRVWGVKEKTAFQRIMDVVGDECESQTIYGAKIRTCYTLI